jgi:Tat (twin-arginine translocation) pathway signal sequence
MARLELSRRDFCLRSGAFVAGLMGSRWLVRDAAVAQGTKLKVAGVYTVPIEQQWVSRIHKALMTAQERGDIDYTWSESVSNTDYPRVLRQYAESGVQLLVGEVFGWSGKRGK